MSLAHPTGMLQDLVLSARALRRSPFVAAAAVLTLAFGIGASTAVFAVLHAVLLRPLAYADPDRLVVLLHDGQFPVSPADYLDYRDQARSFTSVAAAQVSAATLTGTGDPVRVDGLAVTANLFDTLGVAPALGRTFRPGDDTPGRDRLVVLSDALWRERFNASPGIVGTSITLDGEPFVVVGVMPPGFRFAPFWATGARLWRPLALGPRLTDRAGRSLRVFARLRPDVSVPAAQAEAGAIAARLAARFPDTNDKLGISVVPLQDRVVARIRPTLWTLAAMVALVLLIACVNVATLLLVRGASRTRELAVRVALGASRARIVREAIAEALVLSTAGGALGLLVAGWAVPAFVASLPESSIPRQQEIGLDPTVAALAILLSVTAAIAAGLVPALQRAGAGVQQALRDGGRTMTGDAHAGLLRRALLATELALALALLCGAGLVGRSLLALQAVDPGFDPHGVLTLRVAVNGLPQALPDRRVPYFDAVAAALAAVPGVERVGAINHLPLAGDQWRFSFQIAGRPAPRPSDRPTATWRVVGPGYFEAMGIRVRGRALGTRDRADSPPVVVVNGTMARRHWPGADPIGQRVQFSDSAGEWLTVVGVSADARQQDWTGAAAEEVYVPYAQHARAFGGTELTFVLRTGGDPAALARQAQQAVWSVDPNVPVSDVQTMDAVVADQLWRARATALLLGSFAVVALLLAATGIFSVTAYLMSRRTREIGIRMALGARAADVLKLAAADTLIPVAVGVAGGAAAALALSRLVASLLYEVTPADPATFSTAALTLIAVALGAAWIPARRATRVDPLRALRED